MPVSSNDWAAVLAPGIYETFNVGAQQVPDRISEFFRVIGSQRAYEEFFGVGELGIDAWDNFENTDSISVVDFEKGYKTTLTAKEKIVKLPIRRKLYDDAQYATIFDLAGRLGRSMARKRQKDAASVFNNATSSSYVGGDLVALGSNSHPNNPHSSATQDNLYATTTLTEANLETVRQAMEAFTDDKGNLAGVVPDTLLVPPALRNTANILVKSVGRSGTANNDINPLNDEFRVVVWPLLTTSTTWFLIDSTLMKQHLIWIDRVAPYIKPEVMDTTVMMNNIAYMRYSYGWTDWRWIAVCTA